METKKLTRSVVDRRVAGVCGGLAEYLGLDSTLVRLGYVCLSLFSACFPGLLVYIIATIIIPRDNDIIFIEKKD